jgi:hypothetical protein
MILRCGVGIRSFGWWCEVEQILIGRRSIVKGSPCPCFLPFLANWGRFAPVRLFFLWTEMFSHAGCRVVGLGIEYLL